MTEKCRECGTTIDRDLKPFEARLCHECQIEEFQRKANQANRSTGDMILGVIIITVVLFLVFDFLFFGIVFEETVQGMVSIHGVCG